MITKQIQKFIRLEAVGGILLVLVLAIALCVANSSLGPVYEHWIDHPIYLGISHQFSVGKPAILWVNEGLMAIFFMLLALEIKRELLEGDLSDVSQLTLPIFGAIGGILLPVLIYMLLNHGSGLAMRGWPIPTTTDIAFMLGIVALFGRKIPASLRVILVALSIVDDILAVIIIAAFYTNTLSWLSLLSAGLGVCVLVVMNLRGVSRVDCYLLVGLVIWFCVLKSGVHATLGGVAVGLAIPVYDKKNPSISPLRQLEKRLHPWVVYCVLPLFVFFNGGVSFSGLSMAQLFSPVPMGIALGLFVGKTVGVFGALFLVIRLGWAKLPEDISYTHVLGVAALTGIGFTMSLFLSALAFTNTEFENLARQGVLLGSLCSVLLGAFILGFWVKSRRS